MRKLAPAKWGFPFEVEDSSWSFLFELRSFPEILNLVIDHHFEPRSFVEILDL